MTVMQRWFTEFTHGSMGNVRHVGIEIEYSNLSLDSTAQIIQSLFGGHIVSKGRYQKSVEDTKYGRFNLELDAALLKTMDQKEPEKGVCGQLSELAEELSAELDRLVGETAEKIVPFEIAMPPIPIAEMEAAEALVSELRLHGALGTTHALRYAFGVHFNIEPPDMEVETVLGLFRAFLILQAWIKRQSELDFTRQVSPFINDFPSEYLKIVMDESYRPDRNAFLKDYIQHNPARNRVMDMLPILATWDEAAVREKLPDEKISPRPTFHYRLPNSKVDLFRWNLRQEWNLWIPVEILATTPDVLAVMSKEYRQHLGEWFSDRQEWIDRSHQCVLDLLSR